MIVLVDLMEMVMLELLTQEVVEVLLNVRVAVAQEMVVPEDLGVVILRYPNTKTLTASSGLTSTTATDGNDKVTTFTGGTGTVQIN